MEEDSAQPYTLKEWAGALALVALLIAAAMVATAISGYVADVLGLSGEFARWTLFFVAMLILGSAFYRPFWVLAFGLGALAALVTMAAYIVHFQILPAFGFAVLALALGAISTVLLP